MSALNTLIEMGFPQNRVKRALAAVGDMTEPAMEWLLAHADDPGIDDPLPKQQSTSVGVLKLTQENNSNENKREEGVEKMEDEEDSSNSAVGTEENATPKSFKCDDCGKLFKNSDEVEYHALKSGHSNFSESTDEKKPLTAEEKQQKMKELEEKLKERRRIKAEQEEKESLEREKKRIQLGQTIADARRKFRDDEIRRAAEERRREKKEDLAARQKIKEQIEIDKAARREKFNMGGSTSQIPDSPKPQIVAIQQTVNPKKEYATTKLQIRLPTGSPLVQEFNAKETLSAVRLWVSLNREDGVPPEEPFSLSTSFPRRVFTTEDMEKPLDVLGLVPSSVIIVSK